ncbi:tripartite tricarboxylate transporter substrate binding protein [Bacillaceae bacterium]
MMRKKSKVLFSVLLVVTLISLAMAGCTQKQPTNEEPQQESQTAKETDFPNKPIELIIPYSAGGGTDVTARTLIRTVSKYLPNQVSVVPVNKPGASGTIGLAELMQANPDGYKLSMATIGNLSIQPNYGNTPYSYDSFEPILIVTSVPHVLVVKADAPWKTIDEWFDYVKKNPNAFSYSTPGKGNTQHLNMEGVALKDGLKLKHVPYDGAAPALTALLGGHVQGAVVQVHEAKPFVDSGKLRVLANIGTTPSDAMKDVPLLHERGYIGFNAWTGIVAPKGTPREVLAILHDAFKKALEDPDVVNEFKKLGIAPTYSGPEEFKKIAEETFKSAGEIAKQVGLIK